jgi:predicted membrane metal-binding protein
MTVEVNGVAFDLSNEGCLKRRITELEAVVEDLKRTKEDQAQALIKHVNDKSNLESSNRFLTGERDKYREEAELLKKQNEMLSDDVEEWRKRYREEQNECRFHRSRVYAIQGIIEKAAIVKAFMDDPDMGLTNVRFDWEKVVEKVKAETSKWYDSNQKYY